MFSERKGKRQDARHMPTGRARGPGLRRPRHAQRSAFRLGIHLSTLIPVLALIGGLLTGCAVLEYAVVEEHDHAAHGHGEHAHDHGEEGEESGASLAPDETHDEVHLGAKLILRYSDEDDAFIGTVENTTSETLSAVRVEVHLSNGTDLGPTPAQDLEAGETVEVNLPAQSEKFDSWTAHAEVGGSHEEHDHG